MLRGLAIAAALGGCVSIPAFRGDGGGSGSGSGSGGIDAPIDAPGAFAPRIAGKAYRGGGDDGVPPGTTGMTREGYELDRDPVATGELLLFLMTLDNGDATQSFVSMPQGFTKVADHRFGDSETQSMVVGWKFAAANEPTTYTGTYVVEDPPLTSGAAVIMLVAIGGVDPLKPVDDVLENDTGGAGPIQPVLLTSPGVTTKGPGRLILFAGGPNYENAEYGTDTFTPGMDLTTLDKLDDQNGMWDWGSLAVTFRYQALAGPTGMLTGQFDARDDDTPGTPVGGSYWDVAFAIAPTAP